MARKPWEQLTPDYRKRLQRHGITPENYQTADLAGARGHKSKTEENERAKFLRSRAKYIEMTAEMIGQTDELQEELFLTYSEHDQMRIMETQAIALHRYRSGDKAGATQAWNEIQGEIGDYIIWWVMPYHGRKY